MITKNYPSKIPYKNTYNCIKQHHQIKPLRWLGSSLKEIKASPVHVRRDVGPALHTAQAGGIDLAAKPLKGFGGCDVMEIVTAYAGDTWRTVYTVRLAGAVYVLHAFQKKSKSGIATPQRDIELIRQRLKEAERDYRGRQD